MATEQKPECGECVRRPVCGLSVLLDGKAPADCRQFYRTVAERFSHKEHKKRAGV